MKNKKALKITLIIISILLLILTIGGLIFFFSLNKELDLSLIKTGASSVSRLYYYDYDDRENRVGKAIELKDEELFLERSEWASLYEIPKDLQNAFIAIEDKRFFEHSGVDFLRTGKAVINYIFGSNKSSFGGSTITQQLIKNLTGDNQITPKRKLEEILRALNLETKMSKNEILESYLNVVYLSQNCYGVGTGAELYFNKNLDELTLAECATLAAIVKNPVKYDPYKNYSENLKRRKIVLNQMLEQGYITDNEYKNALNENVTISDDVENQSKTGIYSWFTETVLNDVSNDLARKNNISKEAARRLILKGGFNIYTTMDPSLQKKAEEVFEGYKRYILPDGTKYPESACVIIDPKTSDILAVIGGAGKKSANMIFNRATSAKRPLGSVIKPLSVYAPALDTNKITPSMLVEDAPVKLVNGINWPKNSPNVYRGIMPIYYAIEHSVNTIAVKVLNLVGLEKSLEYLREFGIQYDTNSDKNDASIALGQLTYGETLLNATNAYTAFANGGNISKPRSYLCVKDNYGNVILDNKPTKNKVISNESAKTMTELLTGVIKRGTASYIRLNNEKIDLAGKTGTSSNNEDKWFIGYTPDYVCGIWTGYDTPKPIYGTKNPSCILFNELFNKIYSNNDEISNFV
ncbi:MAG: PBP1A family penicillin-binding protein [Clostridia bacterium]|nr:PBP1A family penicillin-binding protein [Clostridia bacterium]